MAGDTVPDLGAATQPPPAVGPGDGSGVDSRVEEWMSRYRRVREQVERTVLPLATSVDGASFEFQASLHHLELKRGGYVSLETEVGRRLGQVTDIGASSATASEPVGADTRGGELMVRLARGRGIVLDGAGDPFHDAAVRAAEPDEVEAWASRVRPDRARLHVGDLLLASGVPAELDAGGLGRHTFLCGQSGSGKTYSLGLLLERILAETTLRIVILDPNSDYVGLPRIRDAADPALAARYRPAAQQVEVWTNDQAANHPLRLRFPDLNSSLQAAVLDLDPIADRDEYAVLADLLRMQRKGGPLVSGPDDLLDSEVPAVRALGVRAQNLGILDWRIWGPDQASLVDELRQPTARCVVVDLGSLDTPQEQRLVADAVLSTLWDARLSRVPTLIVVDEAHNVCAAEPADAVSRLSTEHAVQIAAEGRKFGLYLLTSTQRPHKVHENVVSQCDNLVLMRMNSSADVEDLARTFSFVPRGLMAGATSFGMGQALVAGRIMPRAAYVRMGERVSEEGGADVPATWAAR